MAEVFNVAGRDQSGRQANKRLRREGKIPAILYGHGEASVSLAVTRDEVASALRHSSKLVQLKGAVTESALIRAVQWDHYGIEVLHVDLMRVSESETVNVPLEIELRGEAAGTREGGVVNFITHVIEIKCPVTSLPEKLVVNITNLHLGKAIHASEVDLPAGASLLSDSHAVIVNCLAPLAAGEGEVAVGAVVEPELIRKPKEDKSEE